MKTLRNGLRLWAFLFIGAGGIHTAFADAFDILSSRFSGVFQPLHAATYANGIYLAVGDGGTIVSSADSVTWFPQTSGTTNRLNGVKYGTNGFVAVGDAATILKSTDGSTWFPCASPVTNRLSAISYMSGRYVAVGTSGIIVTSTNGVTWSSINTGAPYNFNGVDGANGLFVAVGDSGLIMTSADGLAWTLRFSGTFSRLNAVSILGDYSSSYPIVAVGDSGTLETSPDGITWTVTSSGTSANLLALANDNANGVTRYGAVGAGGVFVTGNGSVWQTLSNNFSVNLNGLVYTRGNFLTVGDSGVIEAATPWLPRNSNTVQPLNAVVFSDGNFLAAGGQALSPTSNPNIIMQSANGKDWTILRTGNEGALAGVAKGANGYVAVGDKGLILNSTDGSNWTSQVVGPIYTKFNSVAYANSIYVVVGQSAIPPQYLGQNPVAYRSPDGINWSGPYGTSVVGNAAVTFGNNVFVSVGAANIASSPDGITWTSRNTTGAYNLSGVAYGNGVFVTVGVTSAVSTDGTNWSSTPTFGSCIVYGNLGFVAANGGPPIPKLETSLDGTNWTQRGFDGASGAIAFGNGTYVLVGGSQSAAGFTGISQTIATNAQAVPLLRGQPISQGFKLSALSQPNYSYRIQSSTNLAATNWQNVYVYTSTQSVTTVTDAVPMGPAQGFYRIISP